MRGMCCHFLDRHVVLWLTGPGSGQPFRLRPAVSRLRRQMMNDATPPAGELFVTQFLVVSDQDRSRDFYQSVFGAHVVRDRDPVILALANTRILLNVGGGPTADKPTARPVTPANPDFS